MLSCSDKGRFQLFGDTVNTASRMESNGVMGKIHCSESTAGLLPERWLTPREDKIVAKGKGEMQTYWVDANRGAQSSIGGHSSLGGSSEPEEDESDDELETQRDQSVKRELMERSSFVSPSLSVNTNFGEATSEELLDQVEV